MKFTNPLIRSWKPLLAFLLSLQLLTGCARCAKISHTPEPVSSVPTEKISTAADTTFTEDPTTETTEPQSELVELPIETEALTPSTAPANTEESTTDSTPAEPIPTETKPTAPTTTMPAVPSPSDPPHTHSWSSWKQIKAPSCSAAGEETRICVCGKSESREVKSLGHNWGTWKQSKAPTCAAAGTEERRCSRCGQSESRSVPATGIHTWKETEPTCTQDGVRTCTVCGKKETLTALGHNWVHHDEEWHYIDRIQCTCGAYFYSVKAWVEHGDSYPEDEQAYHSSYHNAEEKVVDAPARDICSRCGAVK